MAISPDMSIQYLKQIGEKRAQMFAKLGIYTVRDLVRHFPRQYEDWSRTVSILNAQPGETCCIKATAVKAPQEHRVRKGMTLYKFPVSDGENRMQITLFNNKYAAQKIKAGEEYLFFGTVTGDFIRREMSSPLIEPATTGARIRPIYPQTAGLVSRVIESAVKQVLDAGGDWLDQDPLPASVREQYGLCGYREALENIHFPQNHRDIETARRRLIFEELFVLQLGLLRLKTGARSQNGARVTADYRADFYRLLSFEPTGAQRRAIDDCVRDMASPHPMNRLIQGDVGSGKTAVAAGVAYQMIRDGWQVAMMAPTEILAAQHAKSLEKLFAPAGISVGLLISSQPAAEKKRVLADLQSGDISFVVGTHALLSDKVRFARLGLVITDEQHRFGVEQRAKLAQKGVHPHLLVMSATPIPRTLALIIYSDLDVSILDELPPGRQPVKTYAVSTKLRERACNFIKKQIDAGRQAFIVCPLVEDGETDLASATSYYEQLQQTLFKEYSVGLLHGKMKATDKDAVMAAFVNNELSVLVSTTVVEVGVDVPNATVMLIENAERFGLAQLHQLRGRVGRGKHEAFCVLISDAQNKEAITRLKAMCATNDGFRIADEDLKLRGPGDFFGNRQHGLPNLKLVDLSADVALLQQAQHAAKQLLATDAALAAHPYLEREVRALFAQVGETGLN